MGMIFEELEDHEGYAARRLPDGTLTSTWTREIDAYTGYVAACSCGWTGSHEHPPTEVGRTAAEDQWEGIHARPLLATAVPTCINELVDNLRQELAELADHRPLAARTVANRLASWSEHVLQLTAPAELQRRLNVTGRDGLGHGLGF
jgi:hypothetical protein